MNTLENAFQLIKDTRKNVLSLIQNHDPKILFTIPEPFNNHIFWNAAHLLATHQLLIYTFSGSEERLDKSFIKKYTKGTTPDETIQLDDLHYVIQELQPSVTKSMEDYHNEYYGEYKVLQTSYGSMIHTVEEAFQYVVLHEAMHFGQMKMLEKLLV